MRPPSCARRPTRDSDDLCGTPRRLLAKRAARRARRRRARRGAAPPAAAAAPSPEPPAATLPAGYGVLRSSAEVRGDARGRLSERLALSWRGACEYELTRASALSAVPLGANDSAVALLLGADGAAAPADWLMACLVAGAVSPEAQAAAVERAAEQLVAAATSTPQ